MSLRAIALRLLGRRDYTTAELREKLLDRDAPVADVDAVLAALRAEGLLDDRRAAAAHVRTAAGIKLRGRGRIARELTARGVDRAIADELLGAIPADAEAAAIGKILLKKRFPATPTLAERRRMFQHLLRRGFSSGAIAQALKSRDQDGE